MIFSILHSKAHMPDALEYDDVSENSVEFFFVELLNFSTKSRFFLDTDQPTTNPRILAYISGKLNSPQGQ